MDALKSVAKAIFTGILYGGTEEEWAHDGRLQRMSRNIASDAISAMPYIDRPAREMLALKLYAEECGCGDYTGLDSDEDESFLEDADIMIADRELERKALARQVLEHHVNRANCMCGAQLPDMNPETLAGHFADALIAAGWHR